MQLQSEQLESDRRERSRMGGNSFITSWQLYQGMSEGDF